MANKPIKISFDEKGNLYPQMYPWMKSNSRYIIKEEDNYTFKDTLEYSDYFTPRGGDTHICFVSKLTGRKFNMFMRDFSQILKQGKCNGNIVEGSFTFVKRGSSQGIKLIG